MNTENKIKVCENCGKFHKDNSCNNYGFDLEPYTDFDEVRRCIEDLINAGVMIKDIAVACDCGTNTLYKFRYKDTEPTFGMVVLAIANGYNVIY